MVKKTNEFLKMCLDVEPLIDCTTGVLMEALFDYPNSIKNPVTLIENDMGRTTNLTPHEFVFNELCDIHKRMINTCHTATCETIKDTDKTLFMDYSITDKNDNHIIFYASLTLIRTNGNMSIFKIEGRDETTITLINKDGDWVARKEVIETQDLEPRKHNQKRL